MSRPVPTCRPAVALALVFALQAACVDASKPDGDTRHADVPGADTADTGDTGDTDDTAPSDETVPAPCESWAAPRDVGALADVEREEVSGVAPSLDNPGVLWVHEDHGGAPEVYAVDYSGAALGTLTLEGATNEDWEAMALGRCGGDAEGDCLWLADVGDNDFARAEVALYRVAEPRVGWSGGLAATAPAERFPLVYAEGARNVEAMALTPEGLPVLFTKRGDGISEVFVVDTLVPDVVAAPRLVGTFTTRFGEETTGGLVTSADLWPDGTRLLVRTYERTWEIDLGDAGLDGIGEANVLEVPFAPAPQVEAVAYDTVLRGYWQIAEDENAAITFTACSDAG